MQQNVDSTPKQGWRLHPIWSTIGTILTATGIVDLVIGYYPNPRIPITAASLLGGVVCVVVVLWNPLMAAWHSGYAGFRSTLSVYFEIDRSTDRALSRTVLFFVGTVLYMGGLIWMMVFRSTTFWLVGLLSFCAGFTLFRLRTSRLLLKRR